jgi:molecular chaperone GrpE
MSDDNDIIFDEENEEENPSGLIKKLRERLKNSEEKAQEYLTGWQKERADVVNARKRDEEEKKNFAKYANESLIMELLPALDSFDMALGGSKANKEEWAKLPENWTRGMEYIHSQLISTLESQGVKRIYPLHQEFNPGEHDAIGTVPVDDELHDNKVMEVIQPGYTYHDKNIRTAKVKVGEYKD